MNDNKPSLNHYFDTIAIIYIYSLKTCLITNYVLYFWYIYYKQHLSSFKRKYYRITECQNIFLIFFSSLNWVGYFSMMYVDL